MRPHRAAVPALRPGRAAGPGGWRLAALAVAVAGAGPLAAQQPGLYLNARVDVTHDDNVYRLPADVPLESLGPQARSRSDVTVTPSLRLDAIALYSRQQLNLSLDRAWPRSRDNPGNNRATTGWSASLRGSYPGNLSAAVSLGRDQSQVDFAEVRADQRDVRTTDSRSAALTWALRSDLALSAGVEELSGRSDLAAGRSSDFDSSTWRADLTATSPLGRTFGIGLAVNRTGYLTPLRVFVPPFFFRSAENRFVQHDVYLRAATPIGGRSAASLRLGLVNRRNRELASRDYEGLNGAASLRWAASGKTSFGASWSRDTTTTGVLFRSSLRAVTTSLTVDHRLGARIGLAAGAQRTTYRFGVESAGAAQPEGFEVARSLSLSASWEALDNLLVNLSVTRLSRDYEVAAENTRATVTQIGTSYRSRRLW